MHDAGAVGAVFDSARLCLLDRPAHVLGDRTHLRVGHLALRAEDPAEPPHDRHHVGGRDRDVEIGEAIRDALCQVLATHVIGTGGFGLPSLVALRKHRHGDVAPETMWQDEGPADLLVGMAHVDPEPDVDLDRLGELGGSASP